LRDISPKNRQNAIVSLCQILLHNASLIDNSILQEFVERLRDKNRTVRNAAFKLLSELYRELSSRHGPDATAEQWAKYGWIPTEFFKCYLIKNWELRFVILSSFFPHS